MAELPTILEIYDAIKHGDDNHKKWLYDKLKELFGEWVYPATPEEELRYVIERRFDYLALRKDIAALSGVGSMAATVDEHLKIIGKKLREQAEEVQRLRRITNSIHSLTKGA